MYTVVSTIFTQIIILFLLITVGFVCGKTALFSDTSISQLSSFVLYVVSPCTVIESFLREFQSQLLIKMGTVALIAFAIYGISILLSKLCVRHPDSRVQSVLQYGVIFSNCGYMGLPLLQALYGADGVLYGAVYIAVYNLVAWTYGIALISGDHRQVSIKKLINPGTVGVAIGLVLFLTSADLPLIIAQPISYFSALNVPVPLVICGYYLSKSHFRTLWKQRSYYVTILLRLIVVPGICLILLPILPISPLLCQICIVDAAVPTSVATTMFANRYHQSEETAANIVSATTLLSALTLPILLILSQFFFR